MWFVRLKSVLIVLLLCLLSFSTSLAQINHSYPRIGIFHFGDNAPAEWYARFDLVIVRTSREDDARAIKALNPNAFVFGPKDWNRGSFFEPLADEWKTYHADGSPVNLYGGSNIFTANFSDFCQRLSSEGNMKFNEALPLAAIQSHDQAAFDGIATDGLWLTPRDANGDIDLDRNGVNDYNEHGENWVNDEWKKGVDKVINKILELMPPNNMLILNSGRFHDFYWQESNGLILENHGPTKNFATFHKVYDDWMDTARKPHVLLYDGKGNSKVDFAAMRYLLGVTLFGDGYFSFTENDLHHYHSYYDEYDVDLGFPTTSMQQIRSTGSSDEGVWARFFTKGAVIVNVDNGSNSVSNNDLQSLSGYAGPYYRFLGGQAPNVNNGQKFDQITLTGEDKGSKGFFGDAIILTKEPTIVVSDIIIDSDDEGTAAGSEPAQYKGNWQQTNDNLDKAWSLSYRDYKDAWAIAYAPPGSGESTATFVPTIGVAGKYQVYEWHGDITSLNEASNVPYEIRHADGVATGSINQSRNYGKWNFLGEFNFNKGTSGYLKITNNANGYVIADAVMYVYGEGEIPVSDTQAPAPPTGVKTDTP